MPDVAHRVSLPEMAVGKDRIVEIPDIWTKDFLTPRYTYRVRRSRAALCMHDIIPAVLFVKVRSFRPFRVAQCPLPCKLIVADKTEIFDIKLLNIDVPVPVIAHTVRVRARADIITFSVLIKEYARVDPLRPF